MNIMKRYIVLTVNRDVSFNPNNDAIEIDCNTNDWREAARRLIGGDGYYGIILDTHTAETYCENEVDGFRGLMKVEEQS